MDTCTEDSKITGEKHGRGLNATPAPHSSDSGFPGGLAGQGPSRMFTYFLLNAEIPKHPSLSNQETAHEAITQQTCL